MRRTQAAISYKVKRALQRLRFLLTVPAFTEDELRSMLKRSPLNERRTEIMVAMWKSTSQTVTARMTGAGQGRVRHIVFKTTALLREAAKTDPTVVPAAQWFGTLTDTRAWNALIDLSWTDDRAFASHGKKSEAGSGVRMRAIPDPTG